MIPLEVGIAGVSCLLIGLLVGGIAGMWSSRDMHILNAHLRAENQTLWQVVQKISDRHKDRA